MSKFMSKIPYFKLSAVLLLTTITLNAMPIIAFAATCSGGDTGHCGG